MSKLLKTPTYRKLLYDIEVYYNYFCVGLKDYETKEITFYEVSNVRDDTKHIYDFFKSYQIAFVIIMILVCIAIAALFLNRHKSYR